MCIIDLLGFRIVGRGGTMGVRCLAVLSAIPTATHLCYMKLDQAPVLKVSQFVFCSLLL